MKQHFWQQFYVLESWQQSKKYGNTACMIKIFFARTVKNNCHSEIVFKSFGKIKAAG